jgi:hypothetical protein
MRSSSPRRWRELGLTEKDRLLLRAEVMVRPGHLARAHFGGLERVKEELSVSRHTATYRHPLEAHPPHAVG